MKPVPAVVIGLGVTVIVWAGIALFGGVIALLYLGLGAIMTPDLESLFGDFEGAGFNWAVLYTCLIGQLLGLAAGVLVLVLGIRAKVRRMEAGTTAMVLGIVAFSLFVVVGLVQIPLMGIYLEAIRL
ncbi:hypothetical protein [Brevibacterium litoralis]|uniref:hypothetical protein n=1 Tax=Brevibacterium litoralis TaxID=3138935 RepID=UPI0032EB3082